MPSSFVDEQVQFVATATALQEDLSGVGSSDDGPGELLPRARRGSSTRPASPRRSSPARARRRTPRPRSPPAPRSPRWRRTPAAAAAARRAATCWPTWSPSCRRRQPGEPGHRRRLGADQRQRDVPAAADHLAHADALQQGQGRRGERRAAGGLDGHPEGPHGRRAAGPSVSVNPQYGVWVPANASVLTPLHAGADGRAQRHGERGPRSRRPRSSGSAVDHPLQRLSVPQHRPHVTVVGLGPAGTDLLGTDVADLLAAAPGRAYLRTARHPAAAALRRACPPSTTSTRPRRPSTRSTPASSRRWWRRRSRRRPNRSSTPCPDRRWWPSAPSTCCGPTAGSR